MLQPNSNCHSPMKPIQGDTVFVGILFLIVVVVATISTAVTIFLIR